jgi:hypothetical protein
MSNLTKAHQPAIRLMMTFKLSARQTTMIWTLIRRSWRIANPNLFMSAPPRSPISYSRQLTSSSLSSTNNVSCSRQFLSKLMNSFSTVHTDVLHGWRLLLIIDNKRLPPPLQPAAVDLYYQRTELLTRVPTALECVGDYFFVRVIVCVCVCVSLTQFSLFTLHPNKHNFFLRLILWHSVNN